jgi:error-prone DNA polymerase
MRIAIVAAGFTPSQADGLRRSMAAFRRSGQIEQWHKKLVEGMVARGYERAFAEACFRQIEGFGYYGFPESHSASFALLVYVSAWLKCHYPDVFACAILNAQPMGFYAPAQLVRDAIDHGVEVREVDVNYSDWDHRLEPRLRRGPLQTAVRLGLRQVKGLNEAEAKRIVVARLKPYRTLEELKRRTGVRRTTLAVLAEADAFRSLGLDRRQALWAIQALKEASLPLFDHADAAPGSNLPPIEGGEEPWLELPEMSLGEHVIEDYALLRLSLKAHPLALLRDWLRRQRVIAARELWQADPGRRVAVCGLVLVRQRPGSAKGVIFATLEDETGFANIVVWPDAFERHRSVLMTARLLAVRGTLQREGRVIHVIAERLVDLTPELRRLRGAAIDPKLLDGAMSPADEFKHPTRELREAMPDGRNFR